MNPLMFQTEMSIKLFNNCSSFLSSADLGRSAAVARLWRNRVLPVLESRTYSHLDIGSANYGPETSAVVGFGSDYRHVGERNVIYGVLFHQISAVIDRNKLLKREYIVYLNDVFSF